MKNNIDFLSKWKPNHEKGIYKYVIQKIVLPIVVIFIADIIIIYMHYPVEKSTLHTILFIGIVVSILIIWSNLQQWFKGEKRYTEYNKENELS